MKKILDNMGKVQNAWLYLDPIFNTSDLRDQMIDENSNFSELNEIWKDLITYLEKNPNAINFFDKKGLLQDLETSVHLFEVIYRGCMNNLGAFKIRKNSFLLFF